VAFGILRAVTGQGAYANLALAAGLAAAGLEPRDAAQVTDIVAGTCRALTTLDPVIVSASGRPLKSLQPAVADLLRLGSFEVFAGRSPSQTIVNAYVELARTMVGERATGVVNAVLRRVATRSLDQWVHHLSAGDQGLADALATWHPRWIADEYMALLGHAEAMEALAANNLPPTTTLAALDGTDELIAAGATPGRWSPYAVTIAGDPTPWLQGGRAVVQDEGSQLVCLALARADAPPGDWLDACAGPGGKTALLAGLMGSAEGDLVAADIHEHRARLVRGADELMVADATKPAWTAAHFARVMADVPCSGLGALRRRPDARWRRSPGDVEDLHELQRRILLAAITSTAPGGVVAYVTCSPHRRETVDVLSEVLPGCGAEMMDAPALLPEVPGCASPIDSRYVQLWPHRHGTDAMFLALLRVNSGSLEP